MTFLRSLLFNIYVYVVTLVMGLLWLPTLLWPDRSPVVHGIRWWGNALRWGLRVLCKITHEVHGLEHFADGPKLIAAKHQSMWETAIFFSLIKDPAIVLKRELMWIPIIGWYSAKAGMIQVNRAAAAKALKSMLAQAEARLARGQTVVIFPEGTRRAPLAEPAYKPGVAALYTRLKVPCIPVATNSGLCWPRRTIIKHAGVITLEILPPIEPGLKRRDFEKRLETAIEDASNALAAAATPKD